MTTYYRITLYEQDVTFTYRLTDEWMNDTATAATEWMGDDSFVSVTFEDGAVALIERIPVFTSLVA